MNLLPRERIILEISVYLSFLMFLSKFKTWITTKCADKVHIKFIILHLVNIISFLAPFAYNKIYNKLHIQQIVPRFHLYIFSFVTFIYVCSFHSSLSLSLSIFRDSSFLSLRKLRSMIVSERHTIVPSSEQVSFQKMLLPLIKKFVSNSFRRSKQFEILSYLKCN